MLSVTYYPLSILIFFTILLYAKILIKYETTKLIVIISKVVKMNN